MGLIYGTMNIAHAAMYMPISCKHVHSTDCWLCTLYTAIDTNQIVNEIKMLLSVIKATEPNIKNVMLLILYSTVNQTQSETRLIQYLHVYKALPHGAVRGGGGGGGG